MNINNTIIDPCDNNGNINIFNAIYVINQILFEEFGTNGCDGKNTYEEKVDYCYLNNTRFIGVPTEGVYALDRANTDRKCRDLCKGLKMPPNRHCVGWAFEVDKGKCQIFKNVYSIITHQS